jgi:aryl-alcohol dehydrogenase-like predicted oxidoreductase
MQYTFLGRSGLQVSRLCLGTMNFGMVTDEPTSFSIVVLVNSDRVDKV